MYLMMYLLELRLIFADRREAKVAQAEVDLGSGVATLFGVPARVARQ